MSAIASIYSVNLLLRLRNNTWTPTVISDRLQEASQRSDAATVPILTMSANAFTDDIEKFMII